MEVSLLVCCVVLILYHHAGYPVLLRLFAKRLEGKTSYLDPPGCFADPGLSLLSITLIVPCRNEERVIRRKILNCIGIDYPADKLGIVIALDGCSDATETILRNTLTEGTISNVRVVVIEPNIGKIGVLNRLIPEVQTDLVALSDASALLNRDAISKAERRFTDPQVGVVCGTYLMPEDALPGERAYWNYQIRIKSDEAQIAAPMGAHGAFYMFRRMLWTPLEPDTINDDFVLPMRMVAGGWKALYDRQVVATELEATNSQQDFRRRVRIGAGNLQQTLRLWRLANPLKPGLAFIFISGKALRSFMPFILLAAFAASVALAFRDGGFGWQMLLGTELAAVLILVLGAAIPRHRPRLLDFCIYLAQGYVASGLGALMLLSGHGRSVWRASKFGLSPSRPESSDRGGRKQHL